MKENPHFPFLLLFLTQSASTHNPAPEAHHGVQELRWSLPTSVCVRAAAAPEPSSHPQRPDAISSTNAEEVVQQPLTRKQPAISSDSLHNPNPLLLMAARRLA